MPNTPIRPFEAGDLPQVGALFQKVFRGRSGEAPASLIEHMGDVYLGHPAYDPRIGSLVHEGADGRIDGFIGAIPQPMMLGERAVKGVVTGGFMVNKPFATPLVGARLVKKLLNGPQDLTITDTANLRSLDFQRALRCLTLDIHSLQWRRILQPAAHLLSLAEGRMGRLATSPLRPIARLIDRGFAKEAGPCPRIAKRGWSDADIEIGEFADVFLRFAGDFDLRPSWTKAELAWLLDQATRKTRFGPLYARGVFRQGGELIGAYSYFGRPAAAARALQIAMRPEMGELVFESLFEHAAALGCDAIYGAAQPHLMPGLFRSDAIVFRHASGTHVHARDADIVRALRSGNALIGGLVGEGWTRLVSDEFVDEAGARRPDARDSPRRVIEPFGRR